MDSLDRHTRQLPPLPTGATVVIQNQSGPHSKRWDRTGIVVEVKPHDQYLVKVHGSGRVTLRNRRFLRQITSLSPPGQQFPSTPACSPSSPLARSSPDDAEPAQSTPPFRPRSSLPACQPAMDAERPGSDSFAHDASSSPGPAIGTRDSSPSPVLPPTTTSPASDPLVASPSRPASPAAISESEPSPSDPLPITPHRRTSAPSAASPDAAQRPRRARRPPAYLRDYVTSAK